MNRSVTATYLAHLLDESPDGLAVFPLPNGTSEERHNAMLRDLLDAVAVLQESRSIRLAMFAGEHEDFPDAERLYVVHEWPGEGMGA